MAFWTLEFSTRLKIVSFILLLIPQNDVAGNSRPSATEKWAINIARDFLQGVFSGDKAVLGLLSPELAKAYSEPSTLYVQFVMYSSFSIRHSQSAPDNSELVIRGI